MSFTSYLRTQQCGKVVVIDSKVLENLALEIKNYSCHSQHTHVVACDASVVSSRAGLGFVVYNVLTEETEIAAFKLRESMESVAAELIAVDLLIKFLPKNAIPLIQFDQRRVVQYFNQRSESKKDGLVDEKYIKIAQKMEKKFALFEVWWSKSKSGECLHSITDALAAHAVKGEVKNHQNNRFMSLAQWSRTYDFLQSNQEYGEYLNNCNPYFYKNF